MLFTNDRDRAALHRRSVRDRVFELTSGWNLGSLKGILRPTVGVAAYLVLSLTFDLIAPDFYLLPEEWTWNLTLGLSFGFLMGFGLAYLPVVLFAYVVPLWLDGAFALGVWSVVVFLVGNIATLGIARYLVHRVLMAREVDLEHRPTLILVMSLVPFTALVAAFVSTLNWWFADALPPDSFIDSLLIKAFGNGMGLLLVVPSVLLNGMHLLNRLVERDSAPRRVSGTGAILQWAGLLHGAAGSVIVMSVVDLDRFETYLLLFVPLIVMALRFGLRGLAASFLVVACSKTAMGLFGYTVFVGLSMETTILIALASTLVVGTLASERSRALNTVRRQAALITEAVTRTKRETPRSGTQEIDLTETLERLARVVEPPAIEAHHDDGPAEHEGLLDRLEELVRARERGPENRLAIKDLRG